MGRDLGRGVLEPGDGPLVAFFHVVDHHAGDASALAAVPVSRDAPTALVRPSAEDAGLRGPVDDSARQGLRVELVDPDLLWEARAVGVEEQVEMEDVI